MKERARYHLIACDILYRELSLCIARSRNIVDVTWLPKGLHDMGCAKMSARLQQAVDAVDARRYQAILLGYALCNNGVAGLRASLPLVIPRAHDCITLFLGSHERYQQVFDADPGTYYETAGWMERSSSGFDSADSGLDFADSIHGQLGTNRKYQDLVEQYGEDNARYLAETMGMMNDYDRLLWIDTGVGEFPDYRATVRDRAAQRNWRYEETQGDLRLLEGLLAGTWSDHDFLVIPPGQAVRPAYDGSIMRGCPLDQIPSPTQQDA